MATLFELAESMITDEAKEKWLKEYLADPNNFSKFMEKWLEKSAAEGIKQKPGGKRPPKIGPTDA